METVLRTLDEDGMRSFHALKFDAISAVTERFYKTHGSEYEEFGTRGREACREDLSFHLEFLRPVLEFGLMQPMVDYLRWLDSVLAARAIPTQHLALSLDWLGEFFAEHMNAPQAAVVNDALTSVRTGFLGVDTAPATAPESPEPWPEADALEAALLAGNHREALAAVNSAIDAGHDFVAIELHIIQAALYHIGEKWQANQVTVAQEHMATAIVQSVMTVGLLRSTPPPPINKRILLACVAGNNHAVGLRMVADAFQLAGWDVQYLGPNVPTPALIQQTLEWKPDLIGLSVSFAHQLSVVKAVIQNLIQQLGAARPAVIIGGLAINRFNRLAGAVGADATGPDAQAAVIQGARLVCR